MDRRRTKVAESRTSRGVARGVSPPASRTRSKSPARVENSGRDSAAIVRRGRPKKNETPVEEVSSSSQSSTPKKEIKKTKTTPIILDDSEDNDEVAEINTRSTRLASLRKRLTPVNYKTTPTPYEEKRSVSRSASSLTKEDSEEEDEVEISPQPSAAANLGLLANPFVILLLLESLVLLPIILQFCFKGPWLLSNVWTDLKNPSTYYNKQSGSFFLAFLSGTVLFSFAPVGRFVTLPGSDKPLKFNGIISAIITVGFLFGLELRGLNSLTAIYNNIDNFLWLSVFTNLIIALALYVRAKRQKPSNANPIANSGKFIVDFAAGIEINPKIYDRLDLKAISYHRSIILILIINIAILYKNVSIPIVESSSGAPITELIKETASNLVFIIKNSEYNCASFVVSSLLVLYSLDLLIFEHHLATSYQLNSEGCGAELLLRFATFPFLLSLLPRFLLIKKLDVNCYVLGAVASVFILGLVIKRCSNCLKYQYRLRPQDAKFKDLKTLPTLQSHRLIISHWWSRIRNPSLFGEILLHLVLLAPLAYNFNWQALIGVVYIVGYLIYRSIIINRLNEQKYESAWTRYTAAVKYNLLPRVY